MRFKINFILILKIVVFIFLYFKKQINYPSENKYKFEKEKQLPKSIGKYSIELVDDYLYS